VLSSSLFKWFGCGVMVEPSSAASLHNQHAVTTMLRCREQWVLALRHDSYSMVLMLPDSA
jgi:hypothetical protein